MKIGFRVKKKDKAIAVGMKKIDDFSGLSGLVKDLKDNYGPGALDYVNNTVRFRISIFPGMKEGSVHYNKYAGTINSYVIKSHKTHLAIKGFSMVGDKGRIIKGEHKKDYLLAVSDSKFVRLRVEMPPSKS